MLGHYLRQGFHVQFGAVKYFRHLGYESIASSHGSRQPCSLHGKSVCLLQHQLFFFLGCLLLALELAFMGFYFSLVSYLFLKARLVKTDIQTLQGQHSIDASTIDGLKAEATTYERKIKAHKSQLKSKEQASQEKEQLMLKQADRLTMETERLTTAVRTRDTLIAQMAEILNRSNWTWKP